MYQSIIFYLLPQNLVQNSKIPSPTRPDIQMTLICVHMGNCMCTSLAQVCLTLYGMHLVVPVSCLSAHHAPVGQRAHRPSSKRLHHADGSAAESTRGRPPACGELHSADPSTRWQWPVDDLCRRHCQGTGDTCAHRPRPRLNCGDTSRASPH